MIIIYAMISGLWQAIGHAPITPPDPPAPSSGYGTGPYGSGPYGG
ncbi:MAG: hypothetical protein JWN52_5724 [Actinomycetia bacterium]|nr:hypothetical protein [Actinomycetes bacterium]